jgi:hypothetical protein
VDHPSPNARHLRDALESKPLTTEPADSAAPRVFDIVSTSSHFVKLKTFDLHIRCNHPLFGIMALDCSLLSLAYVNDMVPSTTGAGLRGWPRNYAGAYIVELDDHPIFGTVDFHAACSTILQYLSFAPCTVLRLTLAPERNEVLQDDGVVTRLHLDQLQHVVRVLSETREGYTVAMDELPDDEELMDAIQSVTDDIIVNLASGPDLGVAQINVYEPVTIPSSKWTIRQLKKLPCWPGWKVSETAQLVSMKSDEMYIPPYFPHPELFP